MTRTIVLAALAALLLEPGMTRGQSLLNQPESVVYDSARTRYLVTNKANGQIIAIDSEANQSYFASGLGSCRGITITAGVAYVACDLGVRGFDLASGTQVFNRTVSGMVFLNDIEADTSGYLYVTDSSTGRIYKIRISDGSVTTLVPSSLSGPNGLLYDKRNNRLLVCCWGTNAPIYAINTSTGALTWLVNTGVSDLDGLTEDNDGHLYVSSWGQGKVYRYAASFSGSPLVVSAGHDGPADIFFNRLANTLAIPNFNSNTVSFVDMDSDNDGVLNADDNCPDAYNPDQGDNDGNGSGNICCCTCPTLGNIDGNPDCLVTMGDLTVLIDHLFITLTPLPCPQDGNLDLSPDILVGMGDLTVMIDHLFITLTPLPPCP